MASVNLIGQYNRIFINGLSTENAPFDRADREQMNNYSVFVPDENNEYKRTSLNDYLAKLEGMPDEQYKSKMDSLLGGKNIYFYQNNKDLMPASFGAKAATPFEKNLVPDANAFEIDNEGVTNENDLTRARDIDRSHSPLQPVSEEQRLSRKAAAEYFVGRANQRNAEINSSLTANERLATGKELSPPNDEKSKIVAENYQDKKNSDLPERETLPWYLQNSFCRVIALAVSDTAKETLRRVNSINEAYDKRDALAANSKSAVPSRIVRAKTDTLNIAKDQNKLLAKQKDAQGLENEAIQENDPVISYNKEIIKQANADENAGKYIEEVFNGTKSSTESLANAGYTIDAAAIPKTVAVKQVLNSNDKFPQKSLSYFSLAKMLTVAYSAKEGSEAHNAIRSIIPQDAKIEEIPRTFVARKLLGEAFAGKYNEQTDKILGSFIADAKTNANASIAAYNKGNPAQMGADVYAGASVLLSVLNSTEPEEFTDQESKWPIVAKCVKQLVDITESCPDIAEACPIPRAMLNEMKGWAKISDAVTQSAKAKQQLVESDEINPQTKEKLWRQVFTEIKLRGLCANTYKLNKKISHANMEKEVDFASDFAKEGIRENFALKNKEAHALCTLGENDNLLEAIKSSINIDANKINANKNVCAGWLVAHTKHNNTLNSEIIGNLVQEVSKAKPEPQKSKEGKQRNSSL